MALTNEALDKTCIDNGVTCLLCAQGYSTTYADVVEENPGISEDDAKEAAMSRMLEENVLFGGLDEEFDNDETHPDRLAARWEILDELAKRWVGGDYSGKDEAELSLCQQDCNVLVEKWLAEWDAAGEA